VEPAHAIELDGGTAPEQPSLRRNFSWTLLGNVVYSGCQWAMLMVLAKLTRPDQVGQFSLGLAVTAPVILLAGLQLPAGVGACGFIPDFPCIYVRSVLSNIERYSVSPFIEGESTGLVEQPASENPKN
jgi:hypothetical protein